MRAAVLALVLALPALALDVRVLDMDEQVTTGKGISVDGADLVVQTGDGKEKRIPCDTVVEITFPDNASAAPAKTPMVEVVLSNGDVVRGDVTDGDAGKIILSAGEMGQMVLNPDNLARLVVLQDQNDKKVPADAHAEKMDKIYLTNGDSDIGFAQKLTPEGIEFESDRKEGAIVKYAWKDVAGWFFSGAQPVEMPKGIVATVDCAGGTRLTGTIAKVDGQTLTLTHPVVGDVPIPVAAIRAVYFRNGRVAYLSDMPPAAVDERPFVYSPGVPDTNNCPWQRDVSVFTKGTLKIGKREFRKGLGVHSYCALEFTLGGDYRRFCASAGLDESADSHGYGQSGSVVFQVYAGSLAQVDPELRLYATSEVDWKGLASALAEGKGAAKPIWEAISEDARKPLSEVASGEEATAERKAAIAIAVNAALAKPDLCGAQDFPPEALPADAKEILAKDPAARTPREVDRLHRRCLEAAVGKAIPAVPLPAKRLFDSGLAKFGEEAKEVSVDVAGVSSIVLVVRCGLEGDLFDGETFDRADWGGARLIR